MIKNNCPACSKPLPLLSGDKTTCPSCNTKLTANHGGAVIIVLAIILYIPFKLFTVAIIMDNNTLNTIIIFTGIALVVGVIRHVIISYEVLSTDGS